MNWKVRTLSILILVSILFLQCLLVYTTRSYLWLSLSFGPFILVSIVLCLRFSEEIERILKLYCFLVLILGPFATLGCLLILFLTPRSRIADEYRAALAAEIIFTPSERMELGLKQSLWEAGDTSITPYIDTMEGSNPYLKRNTINKVIQHPGPNSRIILDIGLKDKDPDIRFYAASALILLNDSFVNDFRRIQEKIQLEPVNPVHHYELASSYDRYCTWNLPESDDYAAYNLKMEQSYRTALALDPTYLNAMIGLTRVLITTKDYQGAEWVLQKGLKLYPKSVNLAMLHLKLLFRQRKLTQLKQFATHFSKQYPHVSLEIQEAISFWLQPDKLEKGYEYYVS